VEDGLRGRLGKLCTLTGVAVLVGSRVELRDELVKGRTGWLEMVMVRRIGLMYQKWSQLMQLEGIGVRGRCDTGP